MSLVNSVFTENETVGLETFNTSSLGSLVNGNGVIVHVQYYAPAQRTIGISGAGVVSWTRDATHSYFNGTDAWGVEVFYGVANASSTAPVISISTGTAGYISALTKQFDNYASYLGAVTNRQTAPGTGTGAVTTGNFNIATQPARQIGVFLNYNLGAAPTAVAGFTDHGTFAAGILRLVSRVVTATGNSAATATVASGQGSVLHYSTQIAFEETGGGGGGGSVLIPMLLNH